jgi:hypothetical protein
MIRLCNDSSVTEAPLPACKSAVQMGNLEHILPRLYAEAHAGSSSSTSSSSDEAQNAGSQGVSQGVKLDHTHVHQLAQPSNEGHDRNGVRQSAFSDEL